MAVNFIYIIFLISGFIYFGFVLYFLTGLSKLRSDIKEKLPEVESELPRLTVIVPARNEAENIALTADSLLGQNYPSSAYSIIFINDRSEDRTGEILDSYSERYQNVEVLHIRKKPKGVSPKKYALMQAVKMAETEFIITTDADCNYHENWLKSFALNTLSKPAVVAGLTVFSKENYKSFLEKIWQEMQYIDYISHSLLAAGAIGQGNGFTANGSNMMFRKSLYLENGEQKLKSKVTSGDDFFLIQSAAEEGLPLKFQTSRESIVKSLPVATIAELFNQRARWASKTGSASKFVLTFGINTFLFYMGVLIVVLLAFCGVMSWGQVAVLLFLKIFPETVLLAYGHGLFVLKFKILHFLLLQVFHIPFNLAAGIKGAFLGFTWKGERYRK